MDGGPSGGWVWTTYRNLAPEHPGPVDYRQMMHLLIGKLPLLGCRDGRHPAADTFALLAEQLAGVRSVTRVETADPPTLQAFQVDREGQPGVLVLWDHGEAFGGENEPPVTVTWPWPTAAASVTDAFGQTRTVRAGDGQLRLPVSDTPLFVTR